MNTSDFDDVVPAEVAQLVEARSPHYLAVLTLVLGLLSFLALFHPSLVIVPLVTLTFGVSALWSLAANPEKLGRKAVLIGMTLAMFFGAWAPVRNLVRQRYLDRIARTYADAWVELIRQKKKYEAHQLHVGKSQRPSQGESVEEYYRKLPYAQIELERFFEKEPLGSLLALPENARIEFDRRTEFTMERTSDSIVLRYVAKFDDKGRQRELPFRVYMRRNLEPDSGDYSWLVDGVAEG
jgi:hypothetical protein